MQGQPTPKIVFVRHGHRHKPIPDDDNGLSDKGREQVKDLCKAYEKGSLPRASLFWTSPKARCQETLKPVSDLALAAMKVVKLLDEQQSVESGSQFSKRVSELLEKAVALGETVYLCSHGDLIPEAISQLLGQISGQFSGQHAGKVVDISKGQAIVVTCENGKWDL